MTQEDKELLLKDLCGRLPYHPTVKIYNDSWEGCKIGEFDNRLYYHHVEAFVCDRIEIKPYLRPMSSMTEAERKEYEQCMFHDTLYDDAFEVDWLNEQHFDYRGLISKGLAIEALKDMYKEENDYDI